MVEVSGHIIVVGGGIIGTSIAWRLAQGGVYVTLIDAGRIGGEASSAGAGMLAPGGEVTGPSDTARFLIDSLRRYPGFVRELAGESGLPIDFQICGAIERTDDEHDWDELLRRAELQRALSIRSEVLREGELLFPEDALVNPVDLMQALARACAGRGVE